LLKQPKVAGRDGFSGCRPHRWCNRLQAGRDKLLELNSCRPDTAGNIVHHITSCENTTELMTYLERVCDCYNVTLRDHATDAWRIKPGEQMRVPHFPGLGEHGFVFTPVRSLAVSREDMQFMTWEHPLLTGAMDLVLSDNTGNCAFTTVRCDALPTGTKLLIETSHVLEAVAPPELGLHRFLPTTAFRVLRDAQGRDLSSRITDDALLHDPRNIPKILVNLNFVRQLRNL